jgi:hypothetical protein
MDLVVVEVLERQAVALEEASHGIRRGHEEAFVAVEEVNACRLGVDEPGLDGQAVRCRPLLAAQEHDRGPIGERRRVAGRHRGVLTLAEGRLEGRQLLHRGVGAEVGVLGQTLERGDQIVLEATLVAGGEVPVAGHGELVLGLAGDAPRLGGLGHVLTHRQSGAGLGVARRRNPEVGRAEVGQGEELVLGALGPVHLEQFLAQLLTDRDGGVRAGVDAAGDAGLDLAELDLVGDEDRGLETGPTGLLDVVCRGAG